NLDYKSVINLVNDKNEPYTVNQNPFELIFNEPSPIRDNKATLLTRNQKSVAISLSVSPLINQDNQTVAAVGVFRDVTREREEEKQRSEFISTASHEMRTPVAAIEGYLALAMNESVCRIDSRAREYLNKAHTSTDLLGKLFQDLLTSAKAEDGRLQNHPVVIELGGFLERIADDLRLIAEKKGLVVEYIIGIENPQNIKSNTIGGQKMIKPLYYVYADVERLSEVLVNLTDNAVKYTENGKITVSLTGNDSIVQIRVQDSGIGIPSEDIPHLFEKFYRVDTTATRTINGTGLGLYICRKIIELYNGRIWVDSKLGKGSTFYINLPRISSKTAQELQLKEDVENLPVGVSQSNKM
ncbi:MAG TPA: HAMP domain-containing sensor histidine kinase, partial [Candidatus Saccharibacteria bacterium]|nr:HAMP domain-containing sensor histidine kinase [Candidatus Saccharibacteria bacterium]